MEISLVSTKTTNQRYTCSQMIAEEQSRKLCLCDNGYLFSIYIEKGYPVGAPHLNWLSIPDIFLCNTTHCSTGLLCSYGVIFIAFGRYPMCLEPKKTEPAK